MAITKALIAILLALSLVVSPTTYLLAGGGNPSQGGGGGSVVTGHPWDDEAVESSPEPGSDPNTPGQTLDSRGGSAVIPITTATCGSASQFLAGMMRAVLDKWLRVSELKVTKSKTVKHVR